MTLSTRLRRAGLAVAAAAAAAAGIAAFQMQPSSATPPADHSGSTTTPIKHVVVIFDENVSYDHYFGTYPTAANTDGTQFTARPHTPANNNLVSSGLLTSNPNTYPPTRLSSSQALTCDQNHGYGAEQKALDGGLMDKFVQNVSVDTCSGNLYKAPGLTMDYYDGNTVPAMWNYAQYFAMSDNSWDTTFGPSTPGVLNLVAGQTHGVTAHNPTTGAQVSDAYTVVSPDANGVGTVINDPDPYYDDCSDKNHTATNALAAMSGQNVGDLLNAKGVTWGWFQGGFKPTTPYAGPGTYAVCGSTHTNIGGASSVDYSPHHSPFGYYESTSNPHHLPPSSVRAIGHTDQANHNYDLTDFDAALKANNLPAVSLLKASEYQDGHPGYSDPTDEQNFLVSEINAIQSSPAWHDTAVVIAYDDSDGWYDHVAPTILNGSSDTANDSAICTGAVAKAGVAKGYQDRCGPSQRLPLLVISPFAKANYVDHSYTEQASILKFVEDNWSLGRVGDGSFDTRAGSLGRLFDFHDPDPRWLILNTDGSIKAARGNLHY
ncbi:alkaline phosphatase family protein [Pseudofrankia sp. BMG5.36]|uniref:phospholipase C n=1 Tax=Pseudofrankia sp. BMG5.36 TaxID=1834512 RepID=UPI0008D96C3F|nr:alkaline phosphatase family protein [Pseudofrankia sp. BMG5.36]OHV48034.1 phospholipase [Pseudofrankia sp. BMG5.36]